jgi:PAS domain S-box-containing protein
MEDALGNDGATRASAPANGDEEQFRLLMEGIPDSAIYLLDEQGNVMSWNTGAQRVHGHSTSEILGKSVSVLHPSQTGDYTSAALAAARNTGRFEEEGWRLRNNGSRLWAKTTITPLVSSTGTGIGYSVVVRDLTERRAAEDALRMSEARFEGRSHF